MELLFCLIKKLNSLNLTWNLNMFFYVSLGNTFRLPNCWSKRELQNVVVLIASQWSGPVAE